MWTRDETEVHTRNDRQLNVIANDSHSKEP